MSSVLAKWMTMFIAVTIMFTPILAYVDSLHREAVDQVVYQAMKAASIQGHVSTEIQADIRNKLVTDYNFSDSSILSIEGTSATVPRGGYVEVSVTVKRTPIFVINILNQGSPTYTRTFTIMSEYIP